MSDDSDIEDINVCRKGKRKICVVNDSNSDSDDSQIVNNNRRQRLQRVESESEEGESDSNIVHKRGKNKKMCVVSSSGSSSEDDDAEEDDSQCSTENDSGASSYDEESENENNTQDVAATQSKESGNWSDSSDGQSEKCPICLLTFKTQDIGSPETCDHTFCVECIQEWSKNVNTCPVDRQEFSLILVRRELHGRVVRRIPVASKQATDELMTGGDDGGGGIIDLTYCEICGQSDREDRMLLCDGCDLGYHMECLEPPLDTVPVDEWYCSDCSRDNSGPLADAVEIYEGELDALITEMEEIGGGRLAPRRRRLLPRTRQSERVRANIETQRHQQTINTPGPSTSSLLDNQPSTSSGFDDLSSSQSSRRRRTTTTTTSTSRNKPKKRKRRRRNRRTVGGVIEYEIDDESGVKFALKAKKRRRRKKKKVKRLHRTVSAAPKTVKRRLANQLGISGGLKSKQINNNVLGFQRSQAGITSVSLFGNRNELDYFSDSGNIDDDEDGGAGDVFLGGSAGILARARPASAITLRPQHRHKLKTLSVASPPAATTPCDILGSILDQQSKFLSKNVKLSIGENGTILIDDETKNSKIPIEQQKIDVQSSSNNSTTQVPMYPGYGNNGNRSSYGGSSSFNNNRGGNSYNRGGGGGSANSGGGGNYGNNYGGNNSFRGRGGGNSNYSGNNQYDSRGDNNRYMDFLNRGPSSYQQSRGGFQRGRGAPRFQSTRRPNENNYQRHSFPFDQHTQQELDLSSTSSSGGGGSNVQDHEISRSSETYHQSPPDTSHHPQDHTSSYDDDANNDDLDIYSDIETKDTGTSSPTNDVVGSTAPTLVPPPMPPSLPGIVYGSDSDVNDSDTELVIDDTDKQDDGYDPAEPSAETDSEPDISTSSTTVPPPPSSQSAAESEQIVASTSGEDESKIIGPQLPDEMRKLLVNEEIQPPVNVVQPRIVHLQPKSVNEIDEDSGDDDDRCPNMSIYSSQNFTNYDEDVRGGTEETVSNIEKEKKDDNDDDCPNFSIYSAESMGVAKVSDDDDLVIPSTASVEAESSGGDKPTDSRDDEPDSVQNDEVESSTTDFEKDSISSLPLPPGPAPPPTVVATSVDEDKQEEPDSGVQNADEPDSNNMEKCELTDSENENQSEEISTTTIQKIDDTSTSSATPAKKLPVKIDANMKKDLDRKPTSSSSMRILQLYDDSDFEEWSEGGAPPPGASLEDKDVPAKESTDNNVMAEIEKMTEAVSEEEERCYTPCMDEKKDSKDGNDRNESLGIGGLDTEMVSEDEKNDFDESHEMKTASDGEALEINAKDHELDLAARPEDYEEGEIVEGAAKAMKADPKPAPTIEPPTTQEQIVLTDDNDERPTEAVAPVKDKKKKSGLSSAVNSSFKKVSKNTKERNYRDKENRDRSKSKDKKTGKDRNTGGNAGDKKNQKKKKEKKKELERYDVRNVIGLRAKKDAFGRDETRHRSQSPIDTENRRRKENSWDRSTSRSFTPPASRNRRRTTVTPPPRRRKSSSRSLSPRTRRSVTPIVRGARRKSFSRRRSISPRRRSLSNHRRSLTPPPTRRRSSGRSRSYSPRRNKRSLSRSRSYSPYRPRSTRRSRSPLHANKRRKSRTRSRSNAPPNKNRYRKQHNVAKSKSTTNKKSKKNKKKKSVSPDDHRSRLSLSVTPPLHRNVDNPSVTQTQTEWVGGGGGGGAAGGTRYRRDWTPSWSRSPSPHQQRIQRSNVQNIATWTPPLHYNEAATTALPSSPKLTVYLRNNEAIRKKKDKKKKSGEKRNKDATSGKSKRRRLEQRQRTPPPSKEVFASGDNILVSVSFPKVNENNGNGVTTNVRDVISSSGKRKRNDLDGDGASNKKKKSNKDKSKKSNDKIKKKKKDTSNIKPVAIIDLDQSPFKEVATSPRDVIILSDSDNGEKEAELMERQEMLREELLEMEEENNSIPQSPTENNYTSGPKTPPEPQIKFLIQKPTQLIRNVQNPLHDDQDDDDDDDDVGPEEDMIDPQEELELRLNEVMHKGPNTPPEPPSSPPSSPDVYDPFEPTKSRSPSPTEPPVVNNDGDPITTKATPPDIAESESSLVDLAVGPLEKPSTNLCSATEPTPIQRVMSILNPKQGATPELSPPTPNTVTVSEQDSQTRTSPEKSLDSATNIVNNATTSTTSVKTLNSQPPPAIVKPMVSSMMTSQAATMMIASTPVVQSVAGQTRQNIFNNASGARNTATSSSIPQRIVLPNAANKSSPTKVVSSTTKGPITSKPIKPMQKTIISKLPLPGTKPYVPSRQLKKSGTVQPQKQNNRNNNNNENGIEVIDVDLDFDSPYSPGSSDFEDLFEPPMEIQSNNKVSSRSNTTKNTKSPAKNSNPNNQNAFDSLFGNSPVYKPSTISNKKSKSGTAMKVPVKYDKKQKGGKQVGVKLDEDSLKILDDLPSSAVELQVKNKFLKKLNRQERVVEEVKLVLKPHYNKKHVTKEQYKDILRRSVPKICHNKSGEINPKKIQSLIDAYVRKARIANRKNSGNTGGAGVTNTGVNNTNTVQTNSSMPQTLPKPTKTTFWS